MPAHEENGAKNPLRLSYSSLQVLHECERKFQIEKLLVNPTDKEESAHFSFGHAIGAGVATYLVTGDKNLALYQCWLNYWPVVEMEKKNQAIACAAMMGAFTSLDSLRNKYEVASFNGQPAIELSFRLNINETKYFVGHIDVVLRNKTTGMYYILDIKTTGLQLLDLEAAYMHSGQTLGYSIALDRIVGETQNHYGVLYFVVQLPHHNAKEFACRYHVFDFPKTLVDRLNWFVTLGLDVQHLEALEQIGVFPKRGQSCIRFNKVCRHYGTCSLQNFDEYKKHEVDETEYAFTYELEDLIEEHIERIASMPVIPIHQSPTSPSSQKYLKDGILDLDALI